MIDVDDLPGAELVMRGLNDLRAARPTVAGLLVASAITRLTDLGYDVRDPYEGDVERRLYERLGEDPSVGDPYVRYNALREELVSFLDAASSRARRARRGTE